MLIEHSFIPAHTDRTDDAILQPFRTQGFFFNFGTRLAGKRIPKDNAPNPRVQNTRTRGNSLHESVKLYFYSSLKSYLLYINALMMTETRT